MYIRVKFTAYSIEYTYYDATGKVKVGDEVIVEAPTGKKIVTVVGRSRRSTYDGPVKSIYARVVKDEVVIPKERMPYWDILMMLVIAVASISIFVTLCNWVDTIRALGVGF